MRDTYINYVDWWFDHPLFFGIVAVAVVALAIASSWSGRRR